MLRRQKVKDITVGKYWKNLLHRVKVKRLSVEKYKINLLHREKVKRLLIEKHHNNVLHRDKVKGRSKSKYRDDELHRQKKGMSTRKYCGNVEYRRRVIAAKQLKRQQIKEKAEQFDVVMEQFLEKVKDGPDFVCCVCHRLLFKHQVGNCNRESYRKYKTVVLVADACITEEYLHKCNEDCVVACQWWVQQGVGCGFVVRAMVRLVEVSCHLKVQQLF